MNKLLLLLLLTVCSFVFAENSDFYNKHRDKTINKINILGLKRTRESVVWNILDIKPKQLLSDFNEDEFKQEILKTRVLKKPVISYSLNNDEVIIDITVKDKWTLIPAPIVNISGDNQTYGLLLMENNFLGLKKSLYVNSKYSTRDGLTGSLTYKENNIIPGRLSGALGGGFTNIEEKKLLGSSGEEIGLFSQMSIRGKGELYYRLNRNLTTGFIGSFKYFEIEELEGSDIEFSGQHNYLTGSLYFKADLLIYTPTIHTGLFSKSLLSIGSELTSGKPYLDFTTEISYTYGIIENLYLRAGADISLFDKPYLLEKIWGGKDHSRTLRGKSSDRHFAGSAELEYAVLNFSWGTISSKVLFEGGVHNRDDNSWELYYGPGLGVRMYFPWVSVPAMGIDIGYNMEANYPKFSFTLAF